MSMLQRLSLLSVIALLLVGAPSLTADDDFVLPPIDLDRPLPDVPPPGSDDAPPTRPGAGDRPTDTGDTASGWQLRFYQLNWRRIASSYAELDGRFVVVPAYDRSMPSSVGMRTEQWIAENTKTERVSLGGGLTQRETYKPSRAEAIAVTTRLPNMNPGSYGHLDSVKIEKIVGPNEMIVSDIWLLDKEKVEREREADKKLAARNAEKWISQRVATERERLEDTIARSYRRDYNRNRNDDRYRNRNRNRRDPDEEINRALTTFRNKLVAEQRERIIEGLEKRFENRDKMLEEQAKFSGTKMRLIGFPTRNLREGERWRGVGSTGPQVAIINDPSQPAPAKSANRYKSAKTAPSNVTAISGEMLRAGLSEDRFRDLLKERGLTVESFAELARPIMAKNQGYAKAEVVQAIEGFGQLSSAADQATRPRPKPDRPTRPAPEPDEPAPTPDKPDRPTGDGDAPKPGGDVDIPLPDFDLFED